MIDYFKFSRSALSEELWRDGNMARVYLYLLSKVGEPISFRDTAKSTGLSLQQVRTAIDKLKAANKITQIATQKTTQVATQISLCGIDNKGRPTTQVATQKTTQVATQTETVAKDGFERFRDYFNNAVSGTSIPQITKLTDSRKNALRSIFKEYEKATVERVIQKVLASDFLSREWGKVSFDWIFKKANFIKILEGNYDNGTAKATNDYASRAESRRRMSALASEIVSRDADIILGLYDGQER